MCYLANEGFGVVGIDGLKLEPIPDSLTGRGKPVAAPIRDFSILKQELDPAYRLNHEEVAKALE